jgi:hypothetical protein
MIIVKVTYTVNPSPVEKSISTYLMQFFRKNVSLQAAFWGDNQSYLGRLKILYNNFQ